MPANRAQNHVDGAKFQIINNRGPAPTILCISTNYNLLSVCFINYTLKKMVNDDLNQEIHDTYKYLIDENYSDEEIYRIMAPLLKKKIYQTILVFIVVLTYTYFLTYNDMFIWNMPCY
ncbi:unnamed protein product [Brassicogethes aeneus]|uniref:Uncharacterized protein n=1 Tax=Brassicogethes aeneus TaxID=1431903 RepID=A0A9P0AW90_BRAAE|nr:unnamed protein product [Brassicogethes aeneus]